MQKKSKAKILLGTSLDGYLLHRLLGQYIYTKHFIANARVLEIL